MCLKATLLHILALYIYLYVIIMVTWVLCRLHTSAKGNIRRKSCCFLAILIDLLQTFLFLGPCSTPLPGFSQPGGSCVILLSEHTPANKTTDASENITSTAEVIMINDKSIYRQDTSVFQRQEDKQFSRKKLNEIFIKNHIMMMIKIKNVKRTILLIIVQ